MDDRALRNSEPPLIWDNTMRVMLNGCPRKLYFFLRRFDYSPEYTPVYFTYGRAFHAGMSTWYCFPEDTLPGTETHALRKATAIAAARKLWADAGAVDKPPLDTLNNLENKLWGYFDFYPREPWKYIKAGDEAGWVWPLKGTKYMLGGALDGYVEWPGFGIMYIEHKTTGQYLHEKYMMQYYFSSQILQYAWYLHNLHGGEGVYGGLVNAVTKNIKTAKSNWKTPEFDRLMVKKSSWQFESFEEDVHHDLKTFEQYWNDWYWPQKGFLDPTGCAGGTVGKGGCPFNMICSSGIPFREANPSLYSTLIEKDTPWEPWNRQGES